MTQILSKGFSIHATFQKVQKLKNCLKPFNNAYLILYAKFPLIKQDIYSAIDLTILALVILIEHIVRHRMNIKLYAKALSHLESYLEFLLSDLVKTCKCNMAFLSLN